MPDTAPDSATAARPGTAAVLDFLAAGRLTAFTWLAETAAGTAELAARESLSRAAAEQMAHYDDVVALLGELPAELRAGEPPGAAGREEEPFLVLLEDVGARLSPADWWEQLMRSVTVGGMVQDLDEVLIGWLAPQHAARVRRGLRDPADLAIELLTPAVSENARLQARLALWGRRIAGEALGVVPAVIATLHEHAALAGGTADGAAAELAALATPARDTMSTGHARRMGELGLTA